MRSGNPYDDYINTSIVPIHYDNKAFLVDISNNAYSYSSSLFWFKDKPFRIKMDVSIYGEEEIENIIINSCKIVFDNFSIDFDETELINCSIGTHNSSITKENTTPYFRSYAVFYKDIDTKLLDDYIKRKIIKNNDQQFITVNIDVNYYEKGEIKNWKNATKFYIGNGRDYYTPGNLWGGLP
jgi:hypothetical protein